MLFAAGWMMALVGLPPAVVAADWPTRPVRLIVPVPPGGGADAIARLVGARLTDLLGQQVLVDNRAGANGSIGAAAVAKANADGYTLMVGYAGPLSINPALSKVGYDPLKDFTAIAFLATASNVLVVNPGLPAQSVADLVALARSRPGQLRFGSAGNGSSTHLSGELFAYMAGVSLIHVPYKGAGPAVADTLAGHVEMTFGSLPAAMPHAKTGRLRMIAVSGLKRASPLPDVPTLDESGLKGFDTDQWWGILGPSSLPAAIVARLGEAIGQALRDPAVRDRLNAQGFEVAESNPAAFGRFMRSEVLRWAVLVKTLKIQAGD
jgi:tripartite-type tricarboxylate transporter receptor subunit TctC